MATLFWPNQKLSQSFSYSKNLFNTYGHPINVAIFLWAFAGRINGIPLSSWLVKQYLTIDVSILSNLDSVN